MAEILYKPEVYEIIGVCLEIYNTLGFGFQKVVYKDAIEVEFKDRNISYAREDKFMLTIKV